MVYVDECGVEEFMTRSHGRTPCGERLNVPKPGRRFKRTNVIAGWSNKTKQILAPYIYSWNTTSAWFMVWFEYMLLPLLLPGTLILLDNASFHNKASNRQIVADVASRLPKCYYIHQLSELEG